MAHFVNLASIFTVGFCSTVYTLLQFRILKKLFLLDHLSWWQVRCQNFAPTVRSIPIKYDFFIFSEEQSFCILTIENIFLFIIRNNFPD